LLQRGVARVTLVHLNAEAAGIQSAIAAFRAAAADWPRQPVPARLLPTSLDRRSLTAMAQRLAQRVKDREGVIVLAPVPLGMVVTALLQHGVRVPAQADVISIFHSSEAVTLYPPPTSYPSPVAAIVKQLATAAAHFFTHAALPDLRKTIPVEVARGD
jgi:DNA-binding LacI/PurR family transcriptional regulator